MDGKHVRIDPPMRSGSMYYNYKDFFSIVLLAIVDAQLRFIYVDIGTNGRASDRGIWNNCAFKQCMDSQKIPFPGPSRLPGTEEESPFVIVGDEGFTLSENLLIPYPKDAVANRRDRRIFNCRLSRARRCSENAFGVMGARFQIFMHRTQAVGRAMYTPPNILDIEDEVSGTIQLGEYRQEPAHDLVRLANQGRNRHANAAIELRERVCEYLNTVGRVP
ncbi:hypothetical protein QAD02_021646 [Eretmocerus hayati]|uniref:Uncharacterized protein n=1 Tax=Eretmocerus hayati TaxID=131215 RepID=A0ACC2PQU6_9HYME|nr:hypothetical protein QAD02_021646 [Eretmocerus hayati]